MNPEFTNVVYIAFIGNKLALFEALDASVPVDGSVVVATYKLDSQATYSRPTAKVS